MNKPARAVFILPLLVLPLLSCGSKDTLSLSSDKKEIPADGQSFAVITASITVMGSAVADGTSVKFTTTAGTFSDSDYETMEFDASATGGKAVAKLYPGFEMVKATITATAAISSGGSLSGSMSLVIGETPPVSAKFLTFQCRSRNIGAFIDSLAEKPKIECAVTAKKQDGSEIPNPRAEFLAEAGSFEKILPDGPSEGPVKYVYRADMGAPKDVPPISGEASRTEAGVTRNPRDGLAALLMHTNGEESFDDQNGNGKYDEGEFFKDEPEPFVDENDNAAYDQKEIFLDTNNDGAYTGPNGKRDSSTRIWRAFKILWSGAPHKSSETSRIEDILTQDQTINITCPGSRVFNIYLLDQNLNPIASNDPDADSVYLNYNSVQLIDWPGSVSLVNSAGVTFEKTDRNDDSGKISSFVDSAGNCSASVRCWSVKLADPSGSSSHDPSDASLQADFIYTPVPDSDFYDSESMEYTVGPISGKVTCGASQ